MPPKDRILDTFKEAFDCEFVVFDERECCIIYPEDDEEEEKNDE